MEGLIVPLAAAALLFPIVYLAVPPAVAAWRRRHETRRGFKPSRRPEALHIPDAGETAASIVRFHEALRRSDLSEFLRLP